MIKSKESLNDYLSKDNGYLNKFDRDGRYRYMRRARDPEYYICKYLYYLHHEEYYHNIKCSLFSKIRALYYERKKNRLGVKLGFYIEVNCFEEGLSLYHHGSIIVNPAAKIGKNCKLHGNNCIGNNGLTNLCPKIGNNVDIGFGAVIIGNIEIADDIKIGANAVVNKSFLEPGITIAGVPAKRVK